MKLIIFSQNFKNTGEKVTLIKIPVLPEEVAEETVDRIFNGLLSAEYFQITNSLDQSVVTSLEFGPIFSEIVDL